MPLGDTDPEAEAWLIARLREQPVHRKIRMLNDLTLAVREVARAGVRRRHPEASDREVALRVAALTIDRETMIHLCGWDPEEKGY